MIRHTSRFRFGSYGRIVVWVRLLGVFGREQTEESNTWGKGGLAKGHFRNSWGEKGRHILT